MVLVASRGRGPASLRGPALLGPAGLLCALGSGPLETRRRARSNRTEVLRALASAAISDFRSLAIAATACCCAASVPSAATFAASTAVAASMREATRCRARC